MSASDPLEIFIVDVGNGDCIIVRRGDDYGLVDCNATRARPSPARDKLVDLGAKRLRFVCLTHPDKDHYSGLLDVLNHFRGKIDFFYSFPMGEIQSRPNFVKALSRKYLDMAAEQDDPDVTARAVELVKILITASEDFGRSGQWEELSGDESAFSPGGFPGVEFYSIQPPRRVKGDFYQALRTGRFEIESPLISKALSVDMLFGFSGIKVVLGSDAPARNWAFHRRYLDRAAKTIKSMVVKLPHHGSAKDCDADTLASFFGEAADGTFPVGVISADGKRHPHQLVIDWLLKERVRPYCTNYFHGWQHTVRRLFSDNSLAPELVRLVNEYGDVDLRQQLKCCGDIHIKIATDGKLDVSTEQQRMCGCRVGGIEQLLEAVD